MMARTEATNHASSVLVSKPIRKSITIEPLQLEAEPGLPVDGSGQIQSLYADMAQF